MLEKTSTKQTCPTQLLDQNALDEFKKKYRHDAFCKSKLCNLQKAQKFLKHILKPEVLELIDLSKLQIDPETYVDEELKRLYADVLYRIPLKNSNETIVVFVLIELKTQNDKWTIFQIVKYIVHIWDREFQTVKSAAETKDADKNAKQRFENFLFPMVIPVIFHYGKRKFTSPTELTMLIRKLQGMEEFMLNMKAMLCDATTLLSNNLPQDQELGVLFMVLQMVFSKNVSDHLIKIYRKLQPTLHLQESQQEWYDAVYYAATSAKHFKRQDYINLTKQTQKEGDCTMSTSLSLIDELIAERRTNRAEGKAEGRAEGKAEVIIRILSRRLKTPPKSLQKKINSIRNIAQLDELVDFALTCISLDEFATALK
jgi:predicted transposase YdaD